MKHKFIKYWKDILVGGLTATFVLALLTNGAIDMYEDQVQAVVQSEVKNSKEAKELNNSIMFNTNQDYYDMRASVLKQGEKLAKDPDDIKEADVEYLQYQCGMMTEWSNKGFDVSEEKDVCKLFTTITTNKAKE